AEITSGSSSVTCSPSGWPYTSSAWCRYGRPAAIALPLPPHPTTMSAPDYFDRDDPRWQAVGADNRKADRLPGSFRLIQESGVGTVSMALRLTESLPVFGINT